MSHKVVIIGAGYAIMQWQTDHQDVP